MKQILLLTAAFFFTLNFGFAQDVTAPAKIQMSERASSPGSGPADLYNYHDKKILNALKANEIPSEFPKYDSKSMTEQEYVAICRRWLREHPELVTAEYLRKDAARQQRQH